MAGLTVPELPGHVPLLADALAVCEGMVVNVEIKNEPGQPGHDPGETVAAVTAAAIAEAGWTERVIVSSFQAEHVAGRPGGRQPAGARHPVAVPDRHRCRTGPGGGRGLVGRPSVRDRGRPELVKRAQAAGLAVNVWTVNARHDLSALVELGVEAIITDRLAEALSIARRRGRRRGADCNGY